MSIDLETIMGECETSTFKRGTLLFERGAVSAFAVVPNKVKGRIWISADVEGSSDNEYKVRIKYDEDTIEIISYRCECPAYETYDGLCKHCVAVLLTYKQYCENLKKILSEPVAIKAPVLPMQRVNTDRDIYSLIYSSAMRKNSRFFQPEETGKIELEPLLHRDYDNWSVEFKIGVEKKYVLKDITQFVGAVNEGLKVDYGKRLGFIHDKAAFTPESQKIVTFLQNYIAQEYAFNRIKYNQYHWGYDGKTERRLILTEDSMVRFLDTMMGRTIEFYESKSRIRSLTVSQETPALGVKVEEVQEDGFQVTLPQLECFTGENGLYVRMGAYAYRCDPDFATEMETILKLCKPYELRILKIGKNDMNAFCGTILPLLENYTILKKPDSVEEYRPQECSILVYLDQTKEYITGTVYAQYGEQKYNLMRPLGIEDMYRDMAKERRALEVMAQYLQPAGAEDCLLIPLEDDEGIYKLVSTGISQIQRVGEVYISDALKTIKVLRPSKMSVGVSLNAGLLDIVLDSGRLPMEELKNLLNSYRMKKKYYRLADGSFMQLEGTSLSAIAELTEGLELDERQLESGHLELPRYRSFYVDQVLRENEGEIQIKRQQSFNAILRNMKDVQDSDYEIPSDLCAELRPYQIFGFRWLMTLDDLGFGGILADDMGLGKTIQMISFLLAQAEKREGRHSLIVCPASLVYNWESEIRRFAPSLKILVVAGNATQRQELLRQNEYDVMLTSYDLLKRDVEEYGALEFDYEILDEAQNIKNHTTQVAKAVKCIHSRTRFALTGTPIENSLSELWSIFDFLMPGILSSYKKFKERYEQPIVQGTDDGAAGRFQKIIKPFILRRLKKDVLKELPDKIEKVVYSKMEAEQDRLYFANAQRMLDAMSGQTPEEFKTGKLQILAELTRLRQICCAPSLVYEDYKGGAAKVDTCMELISSAVESGNKLLVFSQFTSMLAILETQLKKAGIPYYLLTGSTSKEKRSELVNSFNRNQIPVFLISLKAGGTGLNLTAASIVIHFDPWWNMAAQNQATDRTHRIGQKQVVTEYRLIMKNTIEEKIQKLQEKKAQLSDQIITDGGITKDLVTKEDFMEILQQEAGQ